ncbi:hypothetical protein AB4Y87_25685 [Paenarthrobacter sp. RAF54_2]
MGSSPRFQGENFTHNLQLVNRVKELADLPFSVNFTDNRRWMVANLGGHS